MSAPSTIGSGPERAVLVGGWTATINAASEIMTSESAHDLYKVQFDAPGEANHLNCGMQPGLLLTRVDGVDQRGNTYTQVLAALENSFPCRLYFKELRTSTLGPNEFRELFKKATQLKTKGILEEAKANLRLVLDHEPRASRSLHLLGVILWDQGGRCELAVRLFQQTVNLRPECPAFHRSLALAFLEGGVGGQGEATDSDSEHTAGMVPDNPKRLNDSKVSNLDLAVRHLQEAARLLPGNPDLMMNLARAFKKVGRSGEAEALYKELTQVDAKNATVWYKLGHLEMKKINPNQAAGSTEAAEAVAAAKSAAEYFAQAVALDPAHDSARYWGGVVSALAGDTPTTAPPTYVAKLFDGYAGTFDEHLVATLRYQTPKLLRELVDTALAQATEATEATEAMEATETTAASVSSAASQEQRQMFRRCADLGCGTGLGALSFAGLIGCSSCSGAGESGSSTREESSCQCYVGGVDLSPKMVEQARLRGIYTELVVSDLTTFLAGEDSGGVGSSSADSSADSSSEQTGGACVPCAPRPPYFDLVICADTLPYIGCLEPLMQVLQGCCEGGGLVVYSVEYLAAAKDARDLSTDLPTDKSISKRVRELALIEQQTSQLMVEHLAKAKVVSSRIQGLGRAAPAALAAPAAPAAPTAPTAPAAPTAPVPPVPPGAAPASGDVVADAAATPATEGCGYCLQLTGRYAHSRWYLHSLAKSHGFRVLAEKEAALRYNKGEPINGLLVLLQKEGSAEQGPE
jgi:predicted TPR repeat methyltransferase